MDQTLEVSHSAPELAHAMLNVQSQFWLLDENLETISTFSLSGATFIASSGSSFCCLPPPSVGRLRI